MLLYSNKSIIRQIFQFHGSVVFGDARQILLGLFLSAVTVFLTYLIEIKSPYAPTIPNNYGLAALGTLVSFAIVFRTNLAWSRYWEALTQCHFMYSKWGDAFTQITVFCSTSLRSSEDALGEESEAKCKRLQVIYSNVVKYFSLLSAMAADRIHHGDTQRMDMRLQMGRWRDQVIRRQDLAKQDLTDAKALPELRVGESLHQQESFQPWSFGKSWKEVAQENWQRQYYVMESPTDAEHVALTESEDRVNLCLTWIIETLAMAAKDLSTPPPIQSRMYQEISNGCLGFTNCVKISDTPFPFCYSQLVSILLIVFCAFVPVFVTAFTQSFFAGPLLTFVIFHTFVCLNDLAKILENPFGQDAEDISLEDFHSRFLMMMEDTRAALDVQHEGNLRGESRRELRRLSVSRSASRTSMLRRVQSLRKEDLEEQDSQSLSERNPSANQADHGEASPRRSPSGSTAPGSISVTGVWCELPQLSQQQGKAKQQDDDLQQPRTNGVSAAGHGSGNYNLLSGVGCWRGLLSSDREAGHSSSSLPFKNVVDSSSSKSGCNIWVPDRDNPRVLATTGLNAGINAQDSRGMEQMIGVPATSPQEQRDSGTALRPSNLLVDPGV